MSEAADIDRVVDPADMIRERRRIQRSQYDRHAGRSCSGLPGLQTMLRRRISRFSCWRAGGLCLVYRGHADGIPPRRARLLFTRQYASAMETRIKTSRDLIALNEGYDAYSGGKYHDAFVHTIVIRSFDSDLST
ncbi:MAG: hypothetical protein R2881_01550 [Eubacteriales bacterium]